MPIIGTPEEIITAIVNTQVGIMVDHIRKVYGQDFPLDVKLAFNKKRNRSWGGKRHGAPYISLALHEFVASVETNSPRSFEEYPAFAGCHIIGSVFNVTWQKTLAVLVAHEIAHAIQWYLSGDCVKSSINNPHEEETGHGDYFQFIYADLRRRFVNSIEHNAPVVIMKAAPIIPAVQKTVQKRKSGIRMDITKSSSGWFTHKYYDIESGTLLATMASKPRHYSQVLIDGKWVVVKTESGEFPKNHPEARKIILGK